MKRPLHIWLAFSACLAILLLAMAFVTQQVLRLDRADARARANAAVEENIRLALWRMDSGLLALLARENSRPYFAYSAFHPLERAYTRMYGDIRPGDVLVPSELLTQTPEFLHLHFQMAPDGTLTSPQAPTGNMRDLAEVRYTTGEAIVEAQRRLAELSRRLDRASLLALLPEEPVPVAAPGPVILDEQLNVPQQQVVSPAAQQAQRGVAEYQQRQRSYLQSSVPQKGNIAQQGNVLQEDKDVPQVRAQSTGGALADAREGTLRPVWRGDVLLLARRVRVDGRVYVQGCWLDWPAIRGSLLAEVRDLLPGADLQPVNATGGEAQQAPAGASRQLAALPAIIVPGTAPPLHRQGLSVLHLSLWVAWGCVLLAVAAVVVLMTGAVSLSERRAAFVSAVTHELRTPLTTLRMYAEMLGEGMVGDPAQRDHYLATLRREADRLGHLVENVLAYARLEGNRARGQVQATTVGGLLRRCQERLTQRALQAQMQLELEVQSGAAEQPLRTDAAAVDQILFNLVDNACKYAGDAADRRIVLRAARENHHVALRVCDSGPGLSREQMRKLFRPFAKSAHDAAHSAPGVGLGLVLSRRLARSLGGDLRHERCSRRGACFLLLLPQARN